MALLEAIENPIVYCSKTLGELVLMHVPQLVSSEHGACNDASLDKGSDDRNSIASHSGALQSAEEWTNAEGRLSGSSDRSCEDRLVDFSKENHKPSISPAAGPALVNPKPARKGEATTMG